MNKITPAGQKLLTDVATGAVILRTRNTGHIMAGASGGLRSALAHRLVAEGLLKISSEETRIGAIWGRDVTLTAAGQRAIIMTTRIPHDPTAPKKLPTAADQVISVFGTFHRTADDQVLTATACGKSVPLMMTTESGARKAGVTPCTDCYPTPSTTTHTPSTLKVGDRVRVKANRLGAGHTATITEINGDQIKVQYDPRPGSIRHQKTINRLAQFNQPAAKFELIAT